MDTAYVIQAVCFGLPGLGLTLGPLPFLYIANRNAAPRRLFICTSPGLLASGLFVLACLISPWTVLSASQPYTAIYQVLLALCATLIIPAVAVLHRRWVGIVHVATATGIACLWLVGMMALTDKWM
ncbi:MAG TPA: hypothetical protein VF471_11145 [Pseudoxanthomonas sp.]